MVLLFGTPPSNRSRGLPPWSHPVEYIEGVFEVVYESSVFHNLSQRLVLLPAKLLYPNSPLLFALAIDVSDTLPIVGPTHDQSRVGMVRNGLQDGRAKFLGNVLHHLERHTELEFVTGVETRWTGFAGGSEVPIPGGRIHEYGIIYLCSVSSLLKKRRIHGYMEYFRKISSGQEDHREEVVTDFIYYRNTCKKNFVSKDE